MRTALRFGNFTPCTETRQVPIRPFTLICGVNSVEESSLMHGFLLPYHARESGEVDVHRTVSGGELGGRWGCAHLTHSLPALAQVNGHMEGIPLLVQRFVSPY